MTVILETFPIWAGMLLAKCAAAGMESGLFRSKYIWDKNFLKQGFFNLTMILECSNFSAPWGQGFGGRGPMQLPPPPPDHYTRQPEARSSLALGTSTWEPNTNYHYP